MITLQFLAEWALRSSILIASGVLLLRVLRVKDPSLRSAATTALLCGSLAIPLLGVALPKVPLPVMTSHPARVERPEVVYPSAATSAPASAVFETNAPVAERGAAPSHHFDWARVAVVLYFIVAGAILLRLDLGWS